MSLDFASRAVFDPPSFSMNLRSHSLRLLSSGSLSPYKPLLIYLPGMDGTGTLFYRQIKSLAPWFDLHCLTIPPQNLSNWEQLAQQAIALVQNLLQQKTQLAAALPGKAMSCPVYLCGESFGGCLALKMAENAPWRLGQLILVNPASSFAQQPLLGWGSALTRWTPEWLYKGTTWGFLPLLAAIDRITAIDRKRLLSAMQSLSTEGVSWRLSLLSQFQFKAAAVSQGERPPLILASEGDRLLPSLAEARRLQSLLGAAQIHCLPQSGHACLLERHLDLGKILQEKNLLPQGFAHSQQGVG